jgi:hypothetical protein
MARLTLNDKIVTVILVTLFFTLIREIFNNSTVIQKRYTTVRKILHHAYIKCVEQIILIVTKLPTSTFQTIQRKKTIIQHEKRNTNIRFNTFSISLERHFFTAQ